MKNITRSTAVMGTASALISMSVLAAQARRWPGDPQPHPVDAGASTTPGHCPLTRVGSRLVRCDDLTGAGVTAPR